MQVAFVTGTTSHHRTAAPTRGARVEAVAAQLAGRRHDVTMLTTRWWDDNGSNPGPDDITIQALAHSPGPTFTARVPWKLRELEPDIVHVVHEDPSLVLATEYGGAPVVVDWYDLPRSSGFTPLRRVHHWVWRRAARSPAAVVTPSKLVETSVRELGRPAPAIRVIPTGIDFDLIRSVDPVNRGEIVYSRYLDAEANLEDLFLALAELREFDWEAVIIGDGPERRTYEAQAADLRIDDRVEFIGDIPMNERLAVFKGGHVYVHTARRAVFPTDLVRALACGCVGIVSYHEQSSAHEFVETKPRGFLPTNADEIGSAIEDAAEYDHWTYDEDFAEFSEDAVVDKYERLYQSIIGGRTYR